MEYSLDSLVDLIRKNLYDRFPYDPNSKSENIRDIAFYNNPISRFDFGEEPFITFEIGNETAERIAPYYHILQDAQYIRKAGYGTKKTRGSQAKVENLGKRDYGRVSFNGKTYSKEYKKNIRGARNQAMYFGSTRYITDMDGNVFKVNRESEYYFNVHYKYIDKILDETLPHIAEELGLKLKRKIDTGLKDEYDFQIVEDLLSFGESVED